MKTVGERIRRVRELRGLSGEELALQVGYKHQSGISNLENRATGFGGYKLPTIAEALNVDVAWLLAGPDDIKDEFLPPFKRQADAQHGVMENIPVYNKPANDDEHELRASIHRMIDKTSDEGLTAMLTVISTFAKTHPRTTEDGAGLRVPAKSLTA